MPRRLNTGIRFTVEQIYFALGAWCETESMSPHMLGDVQFPPSISYKVVSCNGCGGIRSFFCLIALIAFKNVAAGGCAAGSGY